MPCDTRLLILNEMLRLVIERLKANDQRLAECRIQVERTRASFQVAQEGLGSAIFDELRARQAHVGWLNHLKTIPDGGSPLMREKLTELSNANEQAISRTLSAREAVCSFQKALNEADCDFTRAQAAQKKIAEERNLIANEIAKLSSPSQQRRSSSF